MFGAFLPLLLAAAVSGETARPLPLVHRQLTIADGAPDTAVQTMLQARDGFLWVGAAGIARFNGTTFQQLSEENTPGLPELDLHALAEDTTGALWLGGTEAEGQRGLLLVRLSGGLVSRFGAAQGLGGLDVLALHVGPTGTVWVGTDRGAARLTGAGAAARFVPVPGVKGKVLSLLEQPDGELLLGTGDGLFSLRGEAVKAVDAAGAGVEVGALVRTRGGAVWAGTGEGAVRVSGGAPLLIDERSGLPASHVGALCEDHAGRLWIGTTGGLAVLFPGEPAARRVPEVVSSVLQLLEDRERDLWVGTDGDGLHQLREAALRVHALRRDGFPVDAVYSVSAGQDGAIWAGLPAGLVRLRDGKLDTWPEVDGRRGVLAGPVVEASDGRTWVGTSDGIARLESDRLEVVAGRENLPEGAVRALYEDRSHDLWIGTPGGLHRWHAGAVVTFALGDSGPLTWARTVVEDRAGRIWAATFDGLYRIDGGAVTRFGKAEGLVADQVLSLLVDGDDLWVGTGHAGLHLLRDGKLHAVPERSRIPAREVLGLALDRAGDFWQSSSLGLFRASRSALAAAALGGPDEVQLRIFNSSDGLRSLDFNQRGQEGALLGPDGRLWFANALGLVELDPARVWSNPAAPPLAIERLRVNGKVADLTGPLVFPVGAGAVEISYDAPLLRAPDRVRFRFRLGGPAEPWQDAATRRTATFQAMPAGSHLFEVSASNGEGVWSDVGVSVRFTLEPPLWKSPLTLVLAAALLASAVLGLFRLRSVQARRREANLQSLVDDRTSQLAKANQELANNLSELQRAQQHLVAVDRQTSLGLLAAGVAHEVNNPLAYITSNLFFVRDTLPSVLAGTAPQNVSAEVGDAVEEALQGALRVKKIVGGLKTLARGDQGSPRGLVDLPAVLEAALDVGASEVKKHAELVRALGAAPQVRAHEVQVIQLVLNLVLNGAQAVDQAVAERKPGPHRVVVSTSTSTKGEAVIEVSDTGAGMTPEVRARLFTPFFTTKPVGTGTGLGLSVCQAIVTSLGGSIAVDSAPGAGAKFTVTLPAAG